MYNLISTWFKQSGCLRVREKCSLIQRSRGEDSQTETLIAEQPQIDFVKQIEIEYIRTSKYSKGNSGGLSHRIYDIHFINIVNIWLIFWTTHGFCNKYWKEIHFFVSTGTYPVCLSSDSTSL